MDTNHNAHGRITGPESAEELRARLAAIVESSDDAIISKTLEGIITSWNPAAGRIFGYSAVETIGQPILMLFPSDRLGEELEILSRLQGGERIDHFETVRVRKDGRRFEVSVTLWPIRDGNGNIIGASKIARDITERNKARQLHEVAAQEKERLSALVNSITDEIWYADTEGICKLINASGAREFALVSVDGIDLRKLARDLEVLHPDGSLRPIEESPPLRALRGEVVQNQEEIIRTPANNELRYRQVSSSPVRDAVGDIVGSVSVVRDITERKRAEEAVRESEDRFRTMANSMPQLAWIAQADGFISWFNQRWYEYTGTTPQQMEGWGWQKVQDPTVLPRVLEKWHGAIAAGQPFEMEFPLRRADGLFRTFLTRALPLKDAAGKVTNWFGTNTDITAHKDAEKKLREQLARLALLEQITRAISNHLDFQHILKVVTNNLEDNLLVDFCFVCLFDEEDKCEVAQVGLKSVPLAIELALPKHAVFSLDCAGLFQSAMGEVVYQPDIREMKFPFPQRLAKGGLRSLVIAPLPVDGKVIGFLMVARREVRGFLEGECEFLKQLSEHVALAYHQAKLHNSLQTAYDDLRRTQQAAMQRERLRALGQMAGGITHDISNAISPVTLYSASLLEHEPDLSERARDYLQTIHQSVQNVAETIARMREFYRQGEPQVMLTPIQLNNLVQQALDLTRVRWSDSSHERGIVIKTEVRLAEDLVDVMGVESEIRDAIVNLIFNAVDAMPGGGTLTLRTVSKPIAPGTSGTPAARPACLELIDSGIGMDEDTRRRCLEPFFTTKGEDGTGLGLAMVYGMITRHGAEIEIESTPGQGTTVRMLFPVSAVGSNGVYQPFEAKPEPANQRILFVDDDPLLIKSMRDTLETDGHTVVTAAGGQEGIHAFIHAQKRNEAFTVVITDLGMPHVDGRKVASAVKAASPSTPVIMLTGWGPRLEAEGNIPAQVDRLLSKPPKLSDLREALAACCPPSQSKPTKA